MTQPRLEHHCAQLPARAAERSTHAREIKLHDTAFAAGASTVTGITFSGSTSKPVCLQITATASNPSKKPLYDADVFGRVYDANGDAALDQVGPHCARPTVRHLLLAHMPQTLRMRRLHRAGSEHWGTGALLPSAPHCLDQPERCSSPGLRSCATHSSGHTRSAADSTRTAAAP
jgi:hypothetical protein